MVAKLIPTVTKEITHQKNETVNMKQDTETITKLNLQLDRTNENKQNNQ